MVNEWLTEFVALHIEGEGTNVALTGRLPSGFARIYDDTSSVLVEPRQTHFAIQLWSREPSSEPSPIRAMTIHELTQLAAALKGQEQHVRTTVDATLFLLFLQQIDVELGDGPSRRFQKAIFRDIASEGAVVIARFALSGDVEGTIRCSGDALTIEQHVVSLPSGRARSLRHADRLSLAAAIHAHVERAPRPVDPLWSKLAREASR